MYEQKDVCKDWKICMLIAVGKEEIYFFILMSLQVPIGLFNKKFLGISFLMYYEFVVRIYDGVSSVHTTFGVKFTLHAWILLMYATLYSVTRSIHIRLICLSARSFNKNIKVINNITPLWTWTLSVCLSVLIS